MPTAEKGPGAEVRRPKAARSTYREYASRAAFGRRFASGPFSAVGSVSKSLGPERLPQLPGERLHRAARPARQLVLPLALGLEAAVLEAVGPGLHGFADRVEVVGLTLEVARASHDVGGDPDEGAQRGARLDGVLPPRPRRGEDARDRLHVVQEETLGV